MKKNRHSLKHGKHAHPFTCFLMWNMLNASRKSQFSQYLLIHVISSFENIFLDNENKNREKYSAWYMCVHITTRIFICFIIFYFIQIQLKSNFLVKIFYNLMTWSKLAEWNMYPGKLMLYLIATSIVSYYAVSEEVSH